MTSWGHNFDGSQVHRRGATDLLIYDVICARQAPLRAMHMSLQKQRVISKTNGIDSPGFTPFGPFVNED